MMKKIMSRVGLVGFVILITLLILQPPGNAEDFSADMVMTSSMGTMKGKVFFKDGNFRQEMAVAGGQQITIYRKDQNLVRILMPQQKMYMEMPAGSKQAMVPVNPDEIAKMGKKKYLGKEKINGYVCSKYQYTPQNGSIDNATYWIADKLKFPVKIEMDGPSGHMVMEYRNISEKTISGNLFTVPSGYQKMSMPVIYAGDARYAEPVI
ncbi:MAG: DUF4412 domain-containing protein [Desulfobacterales bacterium]